MNLKNTNKNILGQDKSNSSKKNLALISFLFVFFFIAIMLSGFFFYMVQKNKVREEKESELLSISQLKVKQIADYRKERLSEAAFLFNNETFSSNVKEYLKNPSPKTKSVIKDWLYSIHQSHSYQAINIIDTSGNLIFELGNSNDFQKAHIDTFKKCFNSRKVFISNLEKHKSNGKIHLDIFVPLLLHSGKNVENVAIVQFILDPEKNLYEIMQAWPSASKSGEVMVVRREGDSVLYLNELRFKTHTALNFKLPLTNKDLPATKGILGTRGIVEGIDYRGKKVLAALNQVPETNWILVTKIDTEELYESLQSKGLLIVIIVIILLITLVFGFIIIWRGREMNFYKSRLNDSETIKKLNRIYQILTDIKQATIKSVDQEALFREICRIIFEDGNYLLCWIGLLDNDARIIKPVFVIGPANGYIEGIVISPDENSPHGKGPTGVAFRNKVPVIVNNIATDPIMEPWREKALKFNLRSSASFPFYKDFLSYGTLNLYSEKVNFFSTEEIKLLHELSSDISFALKKFETEKQRKNAEENLINSEKLLRNQNEQLASFNEKYIKINEELQESNNRIQKINQELVLAKQKAEESDHLKSAFLANMSHEIRTPMNAIMGFADLLKEGELTPEKRKQYSEIILSRSNDLLHIIDDILDISKIESGTVTLNYSQVSLNSLLDELLVVYTQKLKQIRKTEVELICKKGLNDKKASISTDILKMKQIFTNLLDNAVKFTDQGKIEYGYELVDNILTCYVSDSGIGIEPIYHDKIFERFKQAKINRPKLYGGSGLGLSICRGNAKLLGGDIRVESEPGVGSKFIFTIQYIPGVNIEEKITENNTESNLDISGKKILIVEDDKDNIEFMKELLSDLKPELFFAKNGEEARYYYNKISEFDLVLMDIQLPDVNGYVLTREIKALRKNLPVIAQTAFVMESDKEACHEAGCDNYIAKPIKCENLFNIISQYINK
jgi:signal transduction histidine kinase/CheY-like chemotaxis protein/flagellar basal body-associated protein FliL